MNRSLAPEGTNDARAQTRGSSLLRRLSPYFDRATILGILLLVVLVTLPRLRGLAIQENELDALRTLGVLGDQVFAAEGHSPAKLGDLFAGQANLERRLADTRVLVDGQLIERYGYLFELTEDPADGSGRGLRAWPVEEGRTGQGAFWLNADLELRGHSNRDARWSGVERPPAAIDARSWNALELPGNRREGV